MSAAALYDSGTLFGSLGPFLIAIAAVLGTLVGRARWKDAAESSEHRANELAKEVARLETVAKEKAAMVLKVEAQAKELRSAIDTIGGIKVVEAITAANTEAGERFVTAMEQVTAMFDRHEERAVARHERILGVIETVGHSLGDLSKQINGRSKP